jgi:hypothetical protein
MEINVGSMMQEQNTKTKKICLVIVDEHQITVQLSRFSVRKVTPGDRM